MNNPREFGRLLFAGEAPLVPDSVEKIRISAFENKKVCEKRKRKNYVRESKMIRTKGEEPTGLTLM